MAERTASAQAVAAAMPTRRLGRAALLAIGLGVIAPATNACSNDDDTTDATPDGGFTPAYGAVPPGDASTTPDAMTGVLYGGPTDAGHFVPEDGGGGALPAYGLAPDSGRDLDSGEGEADAGDAGQPR